MLIIVLFCWFSRYSTILHIFEILGRGNQPRGVGFLDCHPLNIMDHIPEINLSLSLSLPLSPWLLSLAQHLHSVPCIQEAMGKE